MPWQVAAAESLPDSHEALIACSSSSSMAAAFPQAEPELPV